MNTFLTSAKFNDCNIVLGKEIDEISKQVTVENGTVSSVFRKVPEMAGIWNDEMDQLLETQRQLISLKDIFLLKKAFKIFRRQISIEN